MPDQCFDYCKGAWIENIESIATSSNDLTPSKKRQITVVCFESVVVVSLD